MNAALLLMTSALGAGGDVTPVEWGVGPPMVVQAGGCCGSPAPCNTCNTCGAAPRVTLLDKIKARFAPKPKCGCGCAPAPVAAPCSTCGTSSNWSQDNLLDRLKARMAAKKEKPCNTCGSCTPGCATPLPPGGIVISPPVNPPPKDMPKPKDPVKDPVKPKTGGNESSGVAPPPIPAPITLPPLPTAPTVSPKPAGISSPY